MRNLLGRHQYIRINSDLICTLNFYRKKKLVAVISTKNHKRQRRKPNP